MGYSHCLALAREGADIAAADICANIDGIYELADDLSDVVSEVRKLGRQAVGVKCDVSKSAEVKAMVNTTLHEFGHIDILVNNAGIEAFNLVQDISEEEWDNVLDVDLKGVFLCTKYVLPHMIEQRSGKIINISSVFGYQGAPMVAHYCAAKFGIVGFTEALAREVAEHNINANAVGPGAINTKMTDAEAPLFGPMMGVNPATYYLSLIHI